MGRFINYMDLQVKELEQSNDNFLERFIKEEKYLQNPPSETKKFIEFCKKRGIVTNEEELEFFEREKLLFPIIRIDRPVGEEEMIKFTKDGNESLRPAESGLQAGEIEIERYKVKYYSSYSFDEYSQNLLLNWVNEGNLFDPTTKLFQNWESFKGEKLEHDEQKVVSFYSSFQIYWLEILKKVFSLNINFASKKTRIQSSDGGIFSGSFKINNINNLPEELTTLSKEKVFQYLFNFNIKKGDLEHKYKEFDIMLKFLLSIQSIYYPYVRSGARKIHFTIGDKKWEQIRNKFDLKNELKLLHLKIDDVAKWYKVFSEKAQKLLGIKRDDWVYIWKNIRWSKKDNLQGNIRLGVEYLQWAVMLKRVIEEYQQREILDIDEISNVSADDILKLVPLRVNQSRTFLRAYRNKRYSDSNKNYYYDKYKRLFYLANGFGLDYQPRITVFVEGETEETILPKVFEWYYGKPENLGIEFINFKGVDQLLSTSENAEKLRKLLIELQKEKRRQILSKTKNTELNQLINNLKNIDIVISNWTSFLSYNLEKWQIIPFFISDNEGNIKHFLEAGEPIRFEGVNYNIPSEWKFIWGIDNNDEPFKGKDFELANFSNQEIANVLTKLLKREIVEQQIQNVRNNYTGIKEIDDEIPRIKIKMAENLFDNLFNQYKITKDNSTLERPIFKVISKIINLAIMNHPPVNRVVELENKEAIKKELGKK